MSARVSENANGSSRSSRLSTLSNGQLHEQYKNRYRPTANGNGNSNGNGNGNTNGNTNGSTNGIGKDHNSVTLEGLKEQDHEKESERSFLGPRLHKLAQDLEERLETQSEKSGWSGTMARNLLERGMWLEEIIESEVDLRTHAIGGIDNMWLLLTSISSFNPVCCATYTFKDNVTTEGVEAMLEKQLRLFPKYKQILKNTGRRWHGSTFVDDPNWDTKRQIQEESLPEPAGRKELDDFTASFIARPWDLEKPLWETIVLKNYRDELSGAKGAMIIRGHHTLTDGQGFVMSQLLVSSYGPELEAMLQDGKALMRGARRGTAKPSKVHKGLKPLDAYQNTLFLQIIMFLLFWSVTLLSSSLEILGSGYQAIVFAFNFMSSSWRLRYATTEYFGPRVQEKEFSTSKAFPMSDIKKLQKAFSGPVPGGWIEKAIGKPRARLLSHITLNDVIADAIAEELDSQPDERLPGLFPLIKQYANSILPNTITLMIPISIRPIGNVDMVNHSTGTLVNLSLGDTSKNGLPIGARPMHARLHSNAKALRAVKNSILPRISFWLVQQTGQAPLLFPSLMWTPFESIVRWCIEYSLESITAVCTNVPGSQKRIEMAGSEVIHWGASPPQAGKNTLGIGIISYANSVCITIAADHVAGKYSEGVAQRLTAGFEKRFKQYTQVADEILDRGDRNRKRRLSEAVSRK